MKPAELKKRRLDAVTKGSLELGEIAQRIMRELIELELPPHECAEVVSSMFTGAASSLREAAASIITVDKKGE